MLLPSHTLKPFTLWLRKFAMLLFGYALGSIPSCVAQPYFDLAGVNYLKSFGNSHSTPSKISFVSSFINFPYRHDSDFTILSAGYDHIAIDADPSGIYNLSGFRASVTHLHKWSGSWKTVFVFNARANSGQGALMSSENYQFGGAFVLTKKVSPVFKYSIGLYYNSEFFGPFFVPLAGVHWRVSSRFALYGLLPSNYYADYLLNKRMHCGIAFSFLTSSYQLERKRYFRYNENQLRTYAHWTFSGSNVFIAEAGYAFYRNFSQGENYRGTDREESLFSERGWIFKVGYAYRIFE